MNPVFLYCAAAELRRLYKDSIELDDNRLQTYVQFLPIYLRTADALEDYLNIDATDMWSLKTFFKEIAAKIPKEISTHLLMNGGKCEIVDDTFIIQMKGSECGNYIHHTSSKR